MSPENPAIAQEFTSNSPHDGTRSELRVRAWRPQELLVYPTWNDNQYLNMLRAEPMARGWSMRGTLDLDEVIGWLTRHDGPVFHLHWTTKITEDAASEVEARARAARIVQAMRSFQRDGGAIVWTIHNALPHDAKFTEAARDLHRELAELVDVIHVLSPSTASVVEPDFPLPPSRVRVIRHSSYAGLVGARVPREQARSAIGMSHERVGVLFFGQLRPYKGIDTLVDALRGLADDPATTGRYELMLAGKPALQLRTELEAIPETGISATMALRFVSDAEVTDWFCAADVCVLPYRAILNSGSLHLAATLGVPCVLPDLPHLRADFGGEQWVKFFDTARSHESIAELIAEEWYLEPAVRAAALAFARAFTPAEMSREYADLLDSLVAEHDVSAR